MNQHKARGARMGMQGLESALTQRQNPSTGEVETLLKVFYVYTVDIAAVSEGASGTGSFTVQADSDFVIQQLTGVAQLVDNTIIASPIATVQITDTGSSFNLFSAPTHWTAIFGTGQLPFILPVPRLLAANAKVNITVNCIEEGASDNHYQIAFIGHRLYKVG